MIRRLRRSDAPPGPWLTPIGWGVCWFEDYGQVAVIAPWGLHWLLRVAVWLAVGVQHRWPRKLDRYAEWQHVTPGWPLVRYLHDGCIHPRWSGMCWYAVDGTYYAPIGLNLVYAIVRHAWLRSCAVVRQ